MASVTFIIGNGLDLSLGLKTSYRDFYEYVKTHNLHPENRIYKAIKESSETWAEFEVALGQYTHYIDNKPEEDRKAESLALHEELGVLINDLADYLEGQEKSFENSPNTLDFTSTGFYEELPVNQASRIRGHLTQTPTFVQFVTLNYTGTTERITSENRGLLAPQGLNLMNPHHVHGSLLQDLTLGVSDESQLSGSMTVAEKNDLIKPHLIRSMNDGRVDTLEQLITSSSIIVLFGTSIGETDRYIWELVNQWLERTANRYLIIHKHDSSYQESTKRLSRKQKQFTSNVQEKILRYSGLDGDEMEKLRSRIFVIHNTKTLFALKQRQPQL